MATPPPSITALPTPPDPNDRTTFNVRAYPWSVAQQTLATQVGAVATNVYDNAVEATTGAATATSKSLLTAADAVATAADRVQTGLDRTAVHEIAITAGVASVNGATGAVTGIADLTTTQTLTNKTLTSPTLTNPIANSPTINGYTEGVTTANTSTAYTINIASASIQILTLTGNCTYTFPTVTAGKSFLLLQTQDSIGSRTVTWPSSVRWAGGTAPTITATASKTDILSFVSDGTYWIGFVGGLNFTRA